MRGGTPGQGQRENKKESFKISAGREGGMGVALSLRVRGGPRPLGSEGCDPTPGALWVPHLLFKGSGTWNAQLRSDSLTETSLEIRYGTGVSSSYVAISKPFKQEHLHWEVYVQPGSRTKTAASEQRLIAQLREGVVCKRTCKNRCASESQCLHNDKILSTVFKSLLFLPPLLSSARCLRQERSLLSQVHVSE